MLSVFWWVVNICGIGSIWYILRIVFLIIVIYCILFDVVIKFRDGFDGYNLIFIFILFNKYLFNWFILVNKGFCIFIRLFFFVYFFLNIKLVFVFEKGFVLFIVFVVFLKYSWVWKLVFFRFE